MGSAADRRVLADLLAVEFQMDPASVQFVAEEMRCLPPLEICRVLADVLGDNVDAAILRSNLLATLSSLLRELPTLIPVLEKHICGRGIVPKQLRSIVRVALAQLPIASPLVPMGSETPAPKPSIIPPRKHRGHSAPVLDLADDEWSITRLPELISRLSGVDKSTHELTIRLGGFAYAGALAILAAWITRRGLAYDIKCPVGMDNYLERIRFNEALLDRNIVVASDPRDWAVGLTRINRDLPTDVVATKITNIIDTFIQPTKEDRDALVILISEMIENVHRHGEQTTDGYAVAQLYPRLLKLGITLVDSGIGVQESFLRGEPSIPLRGLQGDADFLRVACQLHVTSKKRRHSGYGLYILSELLSRNRGTFLLSSGKATVVGYQKNGRPHMDLYRHGFWQGTIVSVVIDLYNKLPISDIYNSMPDPKGFEREEFFQ